jgi:aspartate dehydrogenase
MLEQDTSTEVNYHSKPSTELKIGLIGVGSIGRFLLDSIYKGLAGNARVVVISGLIETDEQLAELAEKYGCAYTRDLTTLAEFEPEVVVEAAAQEVVRQWAIPVLEQGLDLLVMSVGALADQNFCEEVRAAVRRTRRRLYIPSGAVGGLDILRAAGIVGLEEVKLVTSKPPHALAGAPFFQQNGIDPNSLTERTVIFSGLAAEAVKLFPQNVNVAAVLSLGGLGAERTLVEVVADPQLERNLHEVVARGNFGEMRLQLANVPSPANPKTSFLACLSPLALLRRLSEPIWIGS